MGILENPENISEFDSDEEIEVRRTNTAGTAGTTFNRGLEFAEYPHEI